MTQPAEYSFIDGSGNRYHISPDTLEYIPVTPRNSSSGVYSGGEPRTVPLTGNQFTEIRNMLEKVMAEPGIHMQDRVMMSGVIERSTSSGEKTTVIIQPGAAELKAITQALSDLGK